VAARPLFSVKIVPSAASLVLSDLGAGRRLGSSRSLRVVRSSVVLQEVTVARATSQFREFARIGAQARIRDLITEIESILAAFPELGKVAPAKSGQSPSSEKRRPRGARRRRKMSAEARAKIAEAQRKRWAAVKAGTKK
jgi:hypothetical protein